MFKLTQHLTSQKSQTNYFIDLLNKVSVLNVD